jgi:CotH kinase protein
MWTARHFVTALGAIVFTSFAAEAHADCNDPFGKPGEVLEFHVRMKSADWQAILDEDATKANPDGDMFAPPQCDYKYKQFPAEFRCGDGAWMKVSVRKKRGQERGNEAPQKPPLKIDFNQDFMGTVPEAKGQSWPAAWKEIGYRKLTLNNGQGNKPPSRMDNLMLPILMTEHVALRLLKREVPSTPATAYAKLYLHLDGDSKGQYRGVYLMVEDIDRAAIKRYFGNNEGRLIKSTKDNCNNVTEYDDGANAAAAAYDAFIKRPAAEVTGKRAEAEKALDLDALLRQEAIREILVNGDDTILTSANRQNDGLNYFSFDPKEGKRLRQYIPWDVDLTFGQQHGNCAPPPDGTASPGSARLMCSPNEPLFRWCPDSLSELGKRTICVKEGEPTEIRTRYLEIMCQLTQGSLNADSVVKLWDEVHGTLEPIVSLEKDLVWNGMDPNGTVSKSFGAEYKRLREWIPARIKSVQEQITKLGVACPATCEDGKKESCEYLGCAGERRCAKGVFSTCQPTMSCNLPLTQSPPAPAPTMSQESGGCSFGGGEGGKTGLVALLVALGLIARRRGGGRSRPESSRPCR